MFPRYNQLISSVVYIFMKLLTTPVQQKKAPSLAFCIVMDLLGYATFALPFFGEFLDILWAPISAMIFYRTFGGWKGAFGGIFNFIEEILPGLDFIPTFTLTWMWQEFVSRKAMKASGLQRIG